MIGSGYDQRGNRSVIVFIVIVAVVSAMIGGAVMAGFYHFRYGRSDDGLLPNTPSGQLSGIRAESGSVVAVVEKISPSVVGITNKSVAYDWFNRPRVVEQGSGSGVIFHEDGYIATNHHVVEEAREIVVTMQNGMSYPGRIVGLDAMSDLAVIKIDGDGPFPVAIFGDSDEVRVGETAIAIGNPLGFEHTVTVGVISAIDRSLQIGERSLVFLQTDAAINSGNSGGPLVNIRGEVVGINTAKIPGAGIEGLGFAIPISIAEPVLEKLVTSGRIANPWMGVMLVDRQMAEEFDLPDITLEEGVYVIDVVDGSPAFRGGIRTGDIILSISGVAVNTVEELQAEIRKKQVGETTDVTLLRNSQQLSVSVVLGEAPSN
jgi:serine protease Do